MCVAFLSNIVNKQTIDAVKNCSHSPNLFIKMTVIIYHTLFFKMSQTITERHIVIFFYYLTLNYKEKILFYILKNLLENKS